MFSVLEYEREVCSWERDDLRESEGRSYHVEGEGGRGGVEGGERGAFLRRFPPSGGHVSRQTGARAKMLTEGDSFQLCKEP